MKLIVLLLFVALIATINGHVVIASTFDEEKISRATLRDTGCEIGVVEDFTENQPLILTTDTNEFVLPLDQTGKILLKKDEKIQLACTDEFSDYKAKTRVFTCADGNKFVDGTKSYNFKDIKCKTMPSHSAVRTDKKCFNNATIINIGFKISDTQFFKSYEICFDEVLERTHYVTHKFTPGNSKFQNLDDKLKTWTSTGYFKEKNVDELYKGVTHKKTVGEILKSEAYADKYINITGDSKYRLNRGHLAARADFTFANNQRSTYWFMNAAPQWQIFNDGNWNEIEKGIKNFVADRNLEVDVYTGTYGTTHLWDEKDKAHELYLHYDEKSNTKLIPVPKIYYKVMVDRKTKNGIVLVGINNPYLQNLDILKGYILCADVSDKVKWINNYIKWQRTNIHLGYSYACDVNEFMSVVKHLPDDIQVTGLLNKSTHILASSFLLSFMLIILTLIKVV